MIFAYKIYERDTSPIWMEFFSLTIRMHTHSLLIPRQHFERLLPNKIHFNKGGD